MPGDYDDEDGASFGECEVCGSVAWILDEDRGTRSCGECGAQFEYIVTGLDDEEQV